MKGGVLAPSEKLPFLESWRPGGLAGSACLNVAPYESFNPRILVAWQDLLARILDGLKG